MTGELTTNLKQEFIKAAAKHFVELAFSGGAIVIVFVVTAIAQWPWYVGLAIWLLVLFATAATVGLYKKIRVVRLEPLYLIGWAGAAGLVCCALALAGIVLALRKPVQPQLFNHDPLEAYSGHPLAWSARVLGEYSIVDGAVFANALSFGGHHVGEKEVVLKKAYFLSGVTSRTLEAQIEVEDDPRGPANLDEILPVPPGSVFRFRATFPKTARDEFISQWAPITFVVEFDNDQKRIRLDRAVLERAFTPPRLPGFRDPARPRVTRKEPLPGR